MPSGDVVWIQLDRLRRKVDGSGCELLGPKPEQTAGHFAEEVSLFRGGDAELVDPGSGEFELPLGAFGILCVESFRKSGQCSRIGREDSKAFSDAFEGTFALEEIVAVALHVPF